MVMADSGEDAIAFCSVCQYAANLEKAEVVKPAKSEETASPFPVEEVHTPDVKTIEEVCAFLRVKPEEVVKTLVFSCGRCSLWPS